MEMAATRTDASNFYLEWMVLNAPGRPDEGVAINAIQCTWSVFVLWCTCKLRCDEYRVWTWPNLIHSVKNSGMFSRFTHYPPTLQIKVSNLPSRCRRNGIHPTFSHRVRRLTLWNAASVLSGNGQRLRLSRRHLLHMTIFTFLAFLFN